MSRHCYFLQPNKCQSYNRGMLCFVAITMGLRTALLLLLRQAYY
jgi:hypothetical protein